MVNLCGGDLHLGILFIANLQFSQVSGLVGSLRMCLTIYVLC